MNLNKTLIDHFEDPFHQGPCDHKTHEGSVQHEACGDRLTVQLRVADQQVAEVWFDGEGCQLCLAAASILMEAIEGKSWQELEDFTRDELFQACGLTEAELSKDQATCCGLALQAAQVALESPLDDFTEDGPTLAGPHLGDEC